MGDGDALTFQAFAPGIYQRLRLDPNYRYLVARTHFLYRLWSVGRLVGDGSAVDVDVTAFDAISEADYPSIPGDETATVQLHAQCALLLGYFRSVSAKIRSDIGHGGADVRDTNRLGQMHAALSLWDTVETNVLHVGFKFSSREIFPLALSQIAQVHEHLAYFITPWAIETLMSLNPVEQASIVTFLGLSLSVYTALQRQGAHQASGLATLASTLLLGLGMELTPFSPGLFPLLACLSLGITWSRGGVGALLYRVMLNQLFHYASGHVSFVLSTTPSAQAWVQQLHVPRLLHLGTAEVYGHRLRQGMRILKRLPGLSDRAKIEQAGVSLKIQQVVQAGIMLRHLGYAAEVDIVRELRGAANWLVMHLPGGWSIQVAPTMWQRIAEASQRQEACLSTDWGMRPAADADLIRHVDNCWLMHSADGEAQLVAYGSERAFVDNTMQSRVIARSVGPGFVWSVEGGDYPHGIPTGQCGLQGAAGFVDDLRSMSDFGLEYPTGQFAMDSPADMVEQFVQPAFIFLERDPGRLLPSGNASIVDSGTASFRYELPNTAVMGQEAAAASVVYDHLKWALNQSYVWVSAAFGMVRGWFPCCQRQKKSPAASALSAEDPLSKRLAAVVRHQSRGAPAPAPEPGAGVGLPLG